MPNEAVYAYVAALNRVRYEFKRHEPVKPIDNYCGNCGQFLHADMTYCWNCGREIMRDETN